MYLVLCILWNIKYQDFILTINSLFISYTCLLLDALIISIEKIDSDYFVCSFLMLFICTNVTFIRKHLLLTKFINLNLFEEITHKDPFLLLSLANLY